MRRAPIIASGGMILLVAGIIALGIGFGRGISTAPRRYECPEGMAAFHDHYGEAYCAVPARRVR